MRLTLRKGVTLVELMAGVFILALTTLTAATLLPLTAMIRTGSGDYTRAAAVVQRKMEQVRNLNVTRLTGEGLRAANITDVTNTATAPNTYSFTTIDGLGADLTQGEGSIELTNAGTDLVRIDVNLTWRGLRGRIERLDATTFVTSREPWREP